MVQKSKIKLSGVSSFFEDTRKNFKFNLVLVVVLILKSKALYYFILTDDKLATLISSLLHACSLQCDFSFFFLFLRHA